MNSNPPPGQLSETERQYLYDQVKIIGPRTVLESGTWYGGGSTLSITRALHDLGTGGVLHTWEEHAPFHEVAQTFYAASDYSASIVLHRGSFVDGVSAADDAFLADVSMANPGGGPFVLVHSTGSDGVDRVDWSLVRRDVEVIRVSPLTDNMLDWRLAAERAQEVHCVESSFHVLVDSLDLPGKPLFFHTKLRTRYARHRTRPAWAWV